MRLWIDSHDRMMTDEQLLRYIAHFGSLDKALSEGDIHLVSDFAKTADPNSAYRGIPNRHLSDYLKAVESYE